MTANDINFISASGSIGAFNLAIERYPESIVFYQGTTNGVELWIIYADHKTFNFGSYPEFISIKSRLQLAEADIIDLRRECLTMNNIDQSKDNGAALTIANGKVKSTLTLANTSEAGAMSAADKEKLDSIDWVTI